MRGTTFTLAFFAVLMSLGCSPRSMTTSIGAGPLFSSQRGSENVVVFNHVFVTDLTSLGQLAELSPVAREAYAEDYIRPLMKFLFGPGTHRDIGNPQRNDAITIQWSEARVENGKVVLPFRYIGVWILDADIALKGQIVLPVPRSYDQLFTRDWKKCTDSDPEHATESFYWYFWDPARPGCDHVEGVQYDNVEMLIGTSTNNEKLTFPEYSRMIRDHGNQKQLTLTVAFGYVEDPSRPNPETDTDAGAAEYRRFLKTVRSWPTQFSEQPVYLSEYRGADHSRLVIGHRFTGPLHGVQTSLTVVMAAGVDQMVVFAKSFAHDHDGFFAWMGHSRVGNGFDARHFQSLVAGDPAYYSVNENYQMIYWGGCNSYSYYTLPFFESKANASGGRDPSGTKGLDIVAHGLPSLFIFNAHNAEILTSAVLNWPSRPSFQDMLRDLESNARRYGVNLLAAVLGDEDNLR